MTEPVKTGTPWIDQEIAVLEHARPGRKILRVIMGEQPWQPVYFVWDGPIEDLPIPGVGKDGGVVG